MSRSMIRREHLNLIKMRRKGLRGWMRGNILGEGIHKMCRFILTQGNDLLTWGSWVPRGRIRL